MMERNGGTYVDVSEVEAKRVEALGRRVGTNLLGFKKPMCGPRSFCEMKYPQTDHMDTLIRDVFVISVPITDGMPSTELLKDPPPQWDEIEEPEYAFNSGTVDWRKVAAMKGQQIHRFLFLFLSFTIYYLSHH
jgi:hypothetical protein